MSFSPDFDVKDRVKQATDLVDLIGGDLNLTRRGSSYIGHCPWHDDTNPSFNVQPEKQTWVCWVCDFRGDVFDFVMRREGVNFREALEMLAERANIPLTQTSKKVVKGSSDDKATLYRALAWADEEYHQCLLHSDAAIPIREYLADRGISKESIETFRVGFAPLAWSWLVDRARNTSFSPEILEACGLVAANQRGGWYERFRGRVLFPIRDTQERVIAFGGRIVPGLYGEGEEPRGKYVNSPETRLFSKSKNLYALNMARDHVQKSDEKYKYLTIVEGYTDVIAAWQAGLRNVVAALGLALNDQHIRLIKRFADGITLVLDGDEAGQKRTNEVLDLFVANDIDLRILSLPEGLDPFDFLMKNGSAPFEEMIHKAPDAITHKIQIETQGIDLLHDTHRANQALDSLLKSLALFPQKVLDQDENKRIRQSQFVEKLARKFNLDSKQLRSRLAELRNSVRSRHVARPDSDPDANKIDYAKMERKESELIQLLIQTPSMLDKAVENISPDDFGPGVLRTLYEFMGECFHEGQNVGFEQLLAELEDPQLRDLVIYLDQETTDKLKVMEQSGIGLELKMDAQLDSIISAFNQRVEDSGNRAKISKLNEPDLNEKEEKLTLEELFLQQQLKMKKKK